MELIRVTEEHMDDLMAPQSGYKAEIGESAPSREDSERLPDAIVCGQILFFGCSSDGRLIACCSISPVFSTFDYRTGGVFEDFCILPEFRHPEIARKPVEFARTVSGVSPLTVGCADCGANMYSSLGFGLRPGGMYAYEG